MAKLLDGKTIAQEIKKGLKKECQALKNKYGRVPVLACLGAGRDMASSVYVKAQAKAASDIGIGYRPIFFNNPVSCKKYVAQIGELNKDPQVSAVMLQAPLPSGIKISDLADCILAAKDAEGLHPQNLGKVALGRYEVAPCTAEACMVLLKHYKIDLYGKEVVIVGHSNVVGKPLSLMFLNAFATTTVCHIATSRAGLLEGHINRAEILVVAVGRAHLIKGEWIKEGSVVIDVGINSLDGKIVGDVEFSSAFKKASYITPVPGGVGPLTVMMLMKNCLNLFKASMEGSLL